MGTFNKMLLVKTEVRRSDINGLGLFAAEDIPPGTTIWKFDTRIDGIISLEEYDKLPAVAQFHIKRSGWVVDGNFVTLGDDSRFVNHSDTPNTITGDGVSPVVSVGWILRGTEITESYKQFGKPVN